MIYQRVTAFLCTLIAFLFIAGCASIKGADNLNHVDNQHWSGRLSVRTLGELTPGSPPAFHAAFELQGDAQQGEMLVLTPLGSTAVSIRWSPQGAELLARGETRQFGNLHQLVSQTIGTNLPITALFSWLNGHPQDVDGWQVDLSNLSQGRMTARRSAPEPATELRLVLDASE